MKDTHLPVDGLLTFEQVKHFLECRPPVSISFAAREAIIKCRRYLDKKLEGSDALFYGINTGFGFLQDVPITRDQLRALQRNLLLSHACGMGEEVPAEIVRLMLLLKVKSLAYGYSGVSLEVVKRLMEMCNNDVLPVIYTQGSLGASGDLAPLSHMSLPLIGLGEVRIYGEKVPAGQALAKFGWQPIDLQSKEGLALINGTQFMSAYGLSNLAGAQRLLKWAGVIAAISFEAFEGNSDAFHEQLHRVRPHPGQVSVAGDLRGLLEASGITPRKKPTVQDPYSFRCIPQVHGATRDTFDFVLATFLKEVNSVTDNPNIFPDEDCILSGGNFHGQPLALGMDFLAIAMSEIASISERRTYQLLSGQRGLPLFLVKNPGLNSGLMIPQYTAAGIVSENKQLCTPASVDSISSSNNQEDHVSMGAGAATKCYRVIHNVEKVLAIELLTAVQAIEYRRPLRSSEVLEEVIAAFRREVSFNEADRWLHTDIMSAVKFLQNFNPSTIN